MQPVELCLPGLMNDPRQHEAISVIMSGGPCLLKASLETDICNDGSASAACRAVDSDKDVIL